MRIWAAAALAALLVMPAAAAPTNPKPPAKVDAASIDAWIKANLTADGWVLLSADAVSVTWGRPEITRSAEGFLEAEIRREYFRPTRLGAMNSRSNRQSWLLDCGGRRYQVASMSVFLNNNLAGESFRRQGLDNEWLAAPAGAPESQVFDRVCAAGPAKN